MKTGRAVGRQLLYVAYLIGVLVLVNFIFYYFWLNNQSSLGVLGPDKRSSQSRLFDMVSARCSIASISAEEISKRLGWIRSPQRRSSSFLNFPAKKPRGHIRIGVFGDSFVWGDELKDQQDFPYILERHLSQLTHLPVRVLNFGNSGYGAGQSYLLWTLCHQAYELDMVIFLSWPFWQSRDQHFISRLPASLSLLHSRFIVDEGSLKEIVPIGASWVERYRNYTSWIPPQQYLRYDRHSPPFLRALIPRGRELANPFYYNAALPMVEQRTLNRMLLNKIAEAGAPVLHLNGWPREIVENQPGMVELNLDEIGGDVFGGQRSVFPYYFPSGHFTSLGTDRLAWGLASFLAGKPRVRHSSIRMQTTGPLSDSSGSNVHKSFNVHALKLLHRQQVAGKIVRYFPPHFKQVRTPLRQLIQASARHNVLIARETSAPVCARVNVRWRGQEFSHFLSHRLHPLYGLYVDDFCSVVTQKLKIHKCAWVESLPAGDPIKIGCPADGFTLVDGVLAADTILLRIPEDAFKFAPSRWLTHSAPTFVKAEDLFIRLLNKSASQEKILYGQLVIEESGVEFSHLDLQRFRDLFVRR